MCDCSEFKIQFIWFMCYSMQVISNGGVQEVCSYNVLLGKLFADAALTAMTTWGLRIDEVSLIGSHG